jgi:hypothetical protein
MAFDRTRDYLNIIEKQDKNKKLLQEIDRKILNLQKQRAALAKKIENQEGYLSRSGTGKKIKKALELAEAVKERTKGFSL